MLDKIDLPFYSAHAGWELHDTPARLVGDDEWEYIVYTVHVKRRGSKYM